MALHHRACLLAAALPMVVSLGCAPRTTPPFVAPSDAARGLDMDLVAERYVKLVLALGVHDADYVDAYYGPAEWRTEAAAAKKPLPEIRAGASALISEIEDKPPVGGGEL